VRIVIHAIAGIIFGTGLVISGMANPAKVQNFLDVFGSFDPSLAFVMAGAIAVTFAGYRLAFRRSAPIAAERFQLPTRTDIDARLVSGAALFGVGWGLGGYCPGPALTGLPFVADGTIASVAAMLIGLLMAKSTVR
jgi:uncharacterized protein